MPDPLFTLRDACILSTHMKGWYKVDNFKVHIYLILCLFLMVPWVGLLPVIVAFPGNTQLLFMLSFVLYAMILIQIMKMNTPTGIYLL